jgi:hypothetical protein
MAVLPGLRQKLTHCQKLKVKTDMSDIYIAEKLFKTIRERRAVVVEALTEGAVNDIAAFRHLRGKLEVWNEIEGELRTLLKQEPEQDE